MSGRAASADGSFRVTGWVHALGGFIEGRQDLWVRLGDFETRLLGRRLDAVRIDTPVYVSGLPRSGTTILLEVLARHPDVGTHQYRDYPPIHTPFWWTRLLERIETRQPAPAERAHRDRIMVTPASPEAMEEVIWMTFFADAHDPMASSVLDAGTSNLAFERFYREHVAKLLLARRRRRYVSKANYNLARLQYIQKIFPDARFIVPVRRPETHVVSLMRQQRLFLEGTAAEPRARAHLRRVGHLEFGPDRRPLNLLGTARARAVMELWRCGHEVRGWARYWSDVYRFVADRLDADPDLRAATMVVRYEDVCTEPLPVLERILEHARLTGGGALASAWARTIAAPSYYEPALTAEDVAIIQEETRETAGRFGYS